MVTRREDGFVIAALVVAVALLGILSGVAAQKWADVLRRDNEAEMMFRAQEIVRAIQRYRKVRGAPPTKLEQLMEPGPRGEYFLRHLYTDPLVKDGKWGLLYLGPGNTIIDPSEEENAAALGEGIGNEGPFGKSPFGKDGQNKGQGGRSKSAFDRPFGTQAEGAVGGTGASGGAGRPRFGNRRGEEGEMGLPIAGVKTLSKDRPFRYYNGLPEYRLWNFTFFDLENARLPGSGTAPGVTGRGPGMTPPPKPKPPGR